MARAIKGHHCQQAWDVKLKSTLQGTYQWRLRWSLLLLLLKQYQQLCHYSLTSPYGHLYNMDTSLLWTVCLIVEMPKIIHSLPLLIWTPVKQTLCSVPLVSVLKRFDCTCSFKATRKWRKKYFRCLVTFC